MAELHGDREALADDIVTRPAPVAQSDRAQFRASRRNDVRRSKYRHQQPSLSSFDVSKLPSATASRRKRLAAGLALASQAAVPCAPNWALIGLYLGRELINA